MKRKLTAEDIEAIKAREKAARKQQRLFERKFIESEKRWEKLKAYISRDGTTRREIEIKMEQLEAEGGE